MDKKEIKKLYNSKVNLLKKYNETNNTRLKKRGHHFRGSPNSKNKSCVQSKNQNHYQFHQIKGDF